MTFLETDTGGLGPPFYGLFRPLERLRSRLKTQSAVRPPTPSGVSSGTPRLGVAGFLTKKGTLGAGPGRNTPGLLDARLLSRGGGEP